MLRRSARIRSSSFSQTARSRPADAESASLSCPSRSASVPLAPPAHLTRAVTKKNSNLQLCEQKREIHRIHWKRSTTTDFESKYEDKEVDDSTQPVNQIESRQPSHSSVPPQERYTQSAAPSQSPLHASDIPSSSSAPEAPTIPAFTPLPLVWQFIPRHARGAFCDLMNTLLRDYRAARRNSQDEKCNEVIKRIMNVPRNHLMIQFPKKKGRHESLERILKRQLLYASENIVSSNETKTNEDSKEHAETKLRRRNNDEDARVVRKAIQMIKKSGEGLRAVKFLSRDLGQADINDDTINTLQKLHPPASAPLPPLPPAVATRCINVERKALAQIIRRRMNNSASGGPSGWCGKLLLPLANNRECMEGLVVLMEDIINGKIQEDTTRSLLLACRLIPCYKPSGGIRPIAVGETFCKLATLYTMSTCIIPESYEQIFPSIQKGVGFSGGCEQVIHFIRTARRVMGADTMVITIDFKNAFNTRRRRDMWLQLLSKCHLDDDGESQATGINLAPLLPLVHWMYGCSSPLVLPPRANSSPFDLLDVLLSAEGCRQGDPLSNLLFALSVQPLYEQALQYHTASAKALAIQDDFSIVAKPSEAVRVFKKLVELSAAQGMQIEFSKCHVLRGSGSVSESSSSSNSIPGPPAEPSEEQCALEELQRMGVSELKSLHLLGCLISDSEDDATHGTAIWAYNLATAGMDKFFKLLTHRDMPAHIGFHLLYLSGIPRLSYLCRTMTPSSMKNAVMAFDQKVFQVLMQLVDIDIKIYQDERFDEILDLITMNRSHGGLGFHSQSQTQSIAFFASFANSVPSIKMLFAEQASTSEADRRKVQAEKQTLEKILNDCLETIRQSLGEFTSKAEQNGLLPASASQIWDFHPPQHVQKELSALLSKQQQLRLKKSMCGRKDAMARITSSSHPCSGKWIIPDLTSDYALLNKFQLSQAVRHRLGHPLFDNPPSTVCLCAKEDQKTGDLLQDPQHFYSCSLLTKTAMYYRHQLILATILDLCRIVDVQATTSIHPYLLRAPSPSSSPSPPPSLTADQETPDLLVFYRQKRYLLDVSVTCPSAASYCGQASQKMCSAADKRAKEKQDKYAALCKDSRCEFAPFVMESYGAMHKEAEKFLHMLSENYESPTERAEYMAYARKRIAFALQIGNAEIANEGHTLLRFSSARHASSTNNELPLPPRRSENQAAFPQQQNFRLSDRPAPQPASAATQSRHQFHSPRRALSPCSGSSPPDGPPLSDTIVPTPTYSIVAIGLNIPQRVNWQSGSRGLEQKESANTSATTSSSLSSAAVPAASQQAANSPLLNCRPRPHCDSVAAVPPAASVISISAGVRRSTLCPPATAANPAAANVAAPALTSSSTFSSACLLTTSGSDAAATVEQHSNTAATAPAQPQAQAAAAAADIVPVARDSSSSSSSSSSESASPPPPPSSAQISSTENSSSKSSPSSSKTSSSESSSSALYVSSV